MINVTKENETIIINSLSADKGVSKVMLLFKDDNRTVVKKIITVI